MTEETERRPREMQEELEVEKKKKTVELEELAKEMEKEYENRVKKALAQLRFPLVAPVVLVGVPNPLALPQASEAGNLSSVVQVVRFNIACVLQGCT